MNIKDNPPPLPEPEVMRDGWAYSEYQIRKIEAAAFARGVAAASKPQAQVTNEHTEQSERTELIEYMDRLGKTQWGVITSQDKAMILKAAALLAADKAGGETIGKQFIRAALGPQPSALPDDVVKDAERMSEALHQIKQWAGAYPLSIFPEPDFAKAHEVLTANGMTLDAISASNMRHVITQVQEIVDAAMLKEGK